jgi:hypothetical protein
MLSIIAGSSGAFDIWNCLVNIGGYTFDTIVCNGVFLIEAAWLI